MHTLATLMQTLGVGAKTFDEAVLYRWSVGTRETIPEFV